MAGRKRDTLEVREQDAAESAASTPTGRALQVLELAALNGSTTVAEVQAALGIPKPSAHRLIGTLEEMQYLHRSLGRGRYAVSPRLVSLAGKVLQAACTHPPVHVVLLELARLSVGTCSLALQQGDEVLYIDSAVADSPLMLGFQTGRRAPLYCTSSGRIFLSYMSAESLAAYLESSERKAYTSSTVTDAAALRSIVEKAAKRRVAMTESEYVDGVLGAAVPVLGENSKPILALTISIPVARSSMQQIEACIPLMKERAKRISALLRTHMI